MFKKKKEEFNYFNKFIESASYAKEIVASLNEIINNFNIVDIETNSKKIHEIENKADKNLHELKDYLLRDFLPPIEREDILSIAHKIDDIIDGVDEIIIDINIFNVTEIREDMKKNMQALQETINKTYDLLVDFKNMKNVQAIKEKVIEVNNLEEQGDRCYEHAMKNLFKSETNGVEVIKWQKVYESIENSFDACEDVAESVEEVLMKNC